MMVAHYYSTIIKAMANQNDKTIWQLPDIDNVTGDEELPVSYQGKNYNVNISQIATYVKGVEGDDFKPMTDTEIDDIFK